MKKIVSIAILLLVLASVFCGIVTASNSVVQTPVGPAPNSGDGIPDGSGLERPDSPGMGPAPNSGDGIPDGSGF